MNTHKKTIIGVTLLIAFWVVAVCYAQEKERAAQVLPSIKKLMSHEEFTKAGLTKLSDEEIKALDAWLQKHTMEVAKVVAAKAAPEPKDGVIETQVDGTFTGWSGDTVWKMTNGQIWQQAAYAYHYHYAYRPKVLIYRSSSGWKMKVDVEDDEVSVKLIR